MAILTKQQHRSWSDLHAGEPVIRGERLNFAYGIGELRKQILFDLNFTIAPGEVVQLHGPSGCGKTTLLTLIAALRTVREGNLCVLGQELRESSATTKLKVRRRIGFVFQANNLLPFVNAVDNVRIALELRPDVSPEEGRARAEEWLKIVGLEERRFAFPAALSGGQKQRVGLARALVGEPELILADEPTSALDGQTGREVVGLLAQLARARGTAVLMVTHDPRIADLADRVLQMEDGRILVSPRG